MDRRTLYFVMALSLAFLGINIYFSDTAIEQPTAKVASITMGVINHPASLSTSKDSLKHPVKALGSDNTYYTLSDSTSLPKEVWGPEKVALTQQLSLPMGSMTLAIYSESANFTLPAAKPGSGPYHVTLYTEKEKAAAYLYENTLHLLEPFHSKEALIIAQTSEETSSLLGTWDAQQGFLTITEQKALSGHLSWNTMPLVQGPFPYILENETMQIVFSSVDGSVMEINLPLESKSNSASVIKPVGFDANVAHSSPQNNLFPLQPAWKVVGGEKKLVLPQMGGYYPLLRRPELKSFTQIPQFTAEYRNFFCISGKSDPSATRNSLTSFSEDSLSYVRQGEGRSLRTTFSLSDPKTLPYCFNIQVDGQGDFKDLQMMTGALEVELISNAYTPILEEVILKKNKPSLESISLPKDTPAIYSSTTPIWLGSHNGFFTIITQPTTPQALGGFQVQKTEGGLIPSRLSLIDAAFDRYPAKDYPSYSFQLNLAPQKPIRFTTRVFAGPLDKTTLQTIDSTISKTEGSNPQFKLALTHFGFFAFLSEPVSKFLFLLMGMFHFFTHSWGISIILVTFVIRLFLYPFTSWGLKAAAKTQSLEPELKFLKQKYKNDPRQYQLKTMELYKTHGINPLAGCLPVITGLVIQLPFFIGMLDLLKTHFQLRGASFIPGWITDLAAPDVLFSWSLPLPFIGTQFHLLPFLVAAVMFFQPRIPYWLKNTDINTLSEQQRQSMTMMSWMGIAMAVFLYHFPSGLNIYWFFSTLFGIVLQLLLAQRKEFSHKMITIFKRK